MSVWAFWGTICFSINLSFMIKPLDEATDLKQKQLVVEEKQLLFIHKTLYHEGITFFTPSGVKSLSTCIMKFQMKAIPSFY